MTDWPPLPKVVQGLAGPIRILRPVTIAGGGKRKVVLGEWSMLERVIRVKATLSREVAWQTLLHELLHAAMDDGGVNLPERLEEPVSDAGSSGMLHLLRVVWDR